MATDSTNSLLTFKTIAEIPALTQSKWMSGKCVTMTSDRYITVCDQGGLWSSPSVTYIDLAGGKGSQVFTVVYKRHGMDGRIVSATRSPNGKLCIMQNAGNVVWITGAAGFDAGNDLTVSNGRWPIQFTGWLDDNRIVVIPGREIFHVDMTGKASAKLQLSETFVKNHTITDYQQSQARNWSFVAAVQLDVDHAKGSLEVFNVKQSVSGKVSGFAGAFVNEASRLQQILVADTSVDMTCILLKCVEVDCVEQPAAAVKCNIRNFAELKYPVDENGIEKDFPVAVKISSHASETLAFVVTKRGYVHIFDFRGMCHLKSVKLNDSATDCILDVVRSKRGVTVVNNEGQVIQITATYSSIIPLLLEKNMPDAAVRYALAHSSSLPNDVFMSVFLAILRSGSSLDRLLPFCQLNMDHLSAAQALEVLRECIVRLHGLPHLPLSHFAAKVGEKVGVDKVVTIFEQHSDEKRVFLFLNTLSPGKMSESAVSRYVKAGLKTDQLKALTHFVSNIKTPYPKIVLDCLLMENAPPAVIDPLLETFCIKNSSLIQLVIYRLKNRLPVRLRPLLRELPGELESVLKYLLGLNDDLTILDVNFDIGLTAGMLQTVQDSILKELEQDQSQIAALRKFLEFLVAKGVTDPAVHSRLAKLYIERKHLEKLYPFLRNNKLYDAVAIGQWCEEQNDFSIALTIYEERNLSEHFIRVSGQLGSYRRQLSHLLKSRSENLWDKVLSADNRFRLDLLTTMLEMTEGDENAIYDVFEDVSVLVPVIGKTELISETQALIRKLFRKHYAPEQVQFLQLWSLRSLLNGELSEEQMEIMYGEQLYSYDPGVVGSVLQEAGMLRIAKKVFIRGKCWNQAAQLLSSQKDMDLGTMKELADLSRDPKMLAAVGLTYMKNGELVYALRYFVDAGCFTDYNWVCSMVHSDDAFAEWELLIQFLEGARSIAKDSCITVTLALAYGKTSRIQDLDRLMSGDLEMSVPRDANACRICEDLPKNITFVPCGHMVACEGCAKNLKACPICRSVIELKVKTYSA
ncbi:clathrin heavy chain-like isoform X2 [Paramacrobiotus metropolitanus]|uniref:clathrin heavy chain-like isoform X2 n=1 Tax=Paramacrobiotus metropolitanus TaxID=2943436 RepID=UPI0024456A3C|nr:clathrin heavy chain-like isoform X2 [Paramacrobiotus metropolitanus]